jgi:uncharacterized protein
MKIHSIQRICRYVSLFLLCHGLLLSSLLTPSALSAEQTFAQRPTQRVNDWAGVLDQGVQARLETILAELEQKTTAEVAVALVGTVSDGDVDSAAVRMFEEWGIGKRGQDNGVLILCAVSDRRVWIEVGYGLEGILPDAKVGRIISQEMLPYFKKGDITSGIASGVLSVTRIIAADAGVEITGAPTQNSQIANRGVHRVPVLFRILFFLFLGFLFIRYPRLFFFFLMMSMMRGGGYSRGGFGGGSGGFGGGLSGGGGASGGW